jgi:hypothetical protein
MNAIVPIVVSILAVGVGIGVSWLLTAGLGVLLSTAANDNDRIRVNAMRQIDRLLVKATTPGLQEDEKRRLQSAIMSYIMTATSKRTAEKYITRLREVATQVGPELVTATESVFRDRFASE